MKKLLLLAALLMGCEKYDYDWLVVQYRGDGTPVRCYKVAWRGCAANDACWPSYRNGSIVIPGLVTVSPPNAMTALGSDTWEHAGMRVGVDPDKCGLGNYPTTPENNK